ncbi:MAG: bifunctional (p)ppGpp synthetase/guanosine-3',5'-bis(diphosphate) 3'-pyrophosphohydrolase [Clostridiaceae bacterium]|jgi:GTP pyrophosphokinase|nr:bifunctional (p)ppGpp synthetase/guanosine-3',5'-bis(diphosphate) 3'-pyrophosphohydrolase [Clostridiaceae bacterium]
MSPTKERSNQRILDQILERYVSYSGGNQGEKIVRAYQFAMEAHGQQQRATGEPYIIHPLAVAAILIDLEVDEDTLAAALLHDTVEDTGKTVEEIREQFGDDVAALVDGVTKLSRIPYSSKEEIQAENFRKMFLAMAKDIRVVLIKLADRLHNMRTLRNMRPEKQAEKARETLDIYAPLAHRLGIYKIKWELEDLCLRYIDRDAYYELVGAIAQKRSEREKYLEEIVIQLQIKIREMGIKSEIEGRPKHFYSIYRKMKQQQKSLDQIYDLFAARIIVKTVSDCYAVLGLVHELYKPMPGRFKDYIAMPKPNMYQSLHTTVIGPRGIPFEIQIRTESMHRTAEYGIAAHWRYKETAKPSQPEDSFDSKLAWLRQLLEWQKDMRDAGEFMESLKNGLVADEVFVFTPKGDVRSLPAGSVPIDFAYSIHSGVGNRMYGAKVNGRMVPLTYELQNGDIVDILTSDKVHGPSRDWLKIVKSTSARTKISQWFKKEMRQENIDRGREIVDREIKKTGFTSGQLQKSEFIHSILRRYTMNSMDDVYAAVGYGGLSAGRIVSNLRDAYIRSLPDDERMKLGYRVTSSNQVIYSPQTSALVDDKVQAEQKKAKQHGREQSDHGVIVKGIDNCLVRLSRCCSPVPGDPIIGYVTRGKGVAVHRTDCPNIRHLLQVSGDSAADAEKASRLIDVAWGRENRDTTYQVTLKILAHDRRHLLAEVSNAIADEKVSIISGQMMAMKDVTATLTMTIEVNSQSQYDRVLGRIKAIRDVIDVKRGH